MNLSLDTEAINDMFTFGGEKGEILMTVDEEREMFEKEIEDMACIILASMQRESASEPYEEAKSEEFQNKFAGVEKGAKSTFMVPQSMKGVKTIEFQMQKKEKSKQGQQTTKGQRKHLNSTIIEETSPAGTSKSSSSKNHEFNAFGNLTMSNEGGLYTPTSEAH